MKYASVILDFDGTVTKKGSKTPSEKMVKTIIETAKKMPIAFCTGREIASFKTHGVYEIVKGLPVKEKTEVLKNIYLLAENGSLGYKFNSVKKDYEEFYRVSWPEKFIEKEKLMKIFAEKISAYGEVINIHKIVLVIRAYHDENTYVDELYSRSKKIFNICKRILQKLDKNYEKYLHIGDSGIGVILCLADGDKNFAIKRFADFLRKERKMKIGVKAREILVIGDSAQKSGNDYYFLKGDFGTPYTVGYYQSKNKLPKPVIDNKSKKRLLHEKGTCYLLENNL
ncbi:MAG: HAD-IIB family hydrolase [Candidatus Gracilibacteria bacterium]|jgi:HAD superfamily hydrolase (TIGR01484 family)